MSDKFGQVRSFAGNQTFLTGARDLGVGTVDAVSELVDNSIDADAKNIWITIEKNGEGNLRIYVEDDGIGMPKTINRDSDEYDGITYNLSFGSRQEERDVEIGKFGWGLSMSATCQSKLTRVWSTRSDEDRWRCSVADLDVMVNQDDPVPTQSEYRELDNHLEVREPNKESGTIVVFEDADRADYSRPGDAENALIKTLSERYRNYLRGGRDIVVNGTELEPSDPLFTMEEARNPHNIPIVDNYYYTDSFEIEAFEDDVDGMYEVKIRIVELDVKEIRKKDEWSGSWMNKVGLTEENQGFYLMRKGRQIGAGESFNGFFTRNADLNYFRAEIEFPPELDGYFGITTNKSRYTLKDGMKDRLEDSVGDIPGQIKSRTRNKINELEQEAEKESRDKEQTLSEAIAEGGDQYLRPREKRDEREERQVEEEIENEKEKEIKRIKESESLEKSQKEDRIEEIEEEYEGYLEYPFKMTYDKIGAEFYEVRKKGKQTQVVINESHEFYDVYQQATRDSQQRVVLDLLLLSAAHAEELHGDEMSDFIHGFRRSWSTALLTFIEQIPEATDEEIKSLSKSLTSD